MKRQQPPHLSHFSSSSPSKSKSYFETSGQKLQGYLLRTASMRDPLGEPCCAVLCRDVMCQTECGTVRRGDVWTAEGGVKEAHVSRAESTYRESRTLSLRGYHPSGRGWELSLRHQLSVRALWTLRCVRQRRQRHKDFCVHWRQG